MTRKEILTGIFSLVAPGTLLRDGLGRIQEAGLGALIVVGDEENLKYMIDGGFNLNVDFTPQKLYELSKMDGAIMVSENLRKISYANIQLQPKATIHTDESGTRHRTADRVAKQTGNLVLAVSERRNKITIYKGSFRYEILDMKDILAKTSQALMALEKYATAIHHHLTNLTILEFDNMVTVNEVVEGIKKYGLLYRITDELDEYILELGSEGRLIVLQYEELMQGIKEDLYDLIRDYNNSEETVDKIFGDIRKLNKEELLELGKIAHIMGFGKAYSNFDKRITPRGYRILSEIKRITKKDIELLIKAFNDLPEILDATSEDIAKIKGISKFKASSIVRGLKRLRNTLIMER